MLALVARGGSAFVSAVLPPAFRALVLALIVAVCLSPVAARQARAADGAAEVMDDEEDEVSGVAAARPLAGSVLTSVDLAVLWLAVTVEETAGQQVDLHIDILHNGTVVGAGGTVGEHMWGPGIVTSSIINVNVRLFAPVTLEAGDTLGVRILTKRANDSNLRVRIWYGARRDANGSSYLKAHLDGRKIRLYLTGLTCTRQPEPCVLPLSTKAAQKLHGSVAKAARDFKPFATWELVVE